MLFNIVLIPMIIYCILLIIKIKNNLTSLHFTSKKGIEKSKHTLNPEDIRDYNLKYILPVWCIVLITLILMSISTFIVDKEHLDFPIETGFKSIMIIGFISYVLGVIDLNKKMKK